MKKFFIASVAVLGLSVLAWQSYAAPSATQKFTVVVPQTISITAPSDVSITHDTTDNNQSFPTQTWAVKGNTLSGVSVLFTVNQPFTHTTNNTFKRDAQVGLALGTHAGPATWTISKASDATAYGSGTNTATVTASSNGVGTANLNLSMAFVTDIFGTFAAGDYETTVTGTVTAN